MAENQPSGSTSQCLELVAESDFAGTHSFYGLDGHLQGWVFGWCVLEWFGVQGGSCRWRSCLENWELAEVELP